MHYFPPKQRFTAICFWAVAFTNPASPANDFSDSNADPDADGYTRLDDYLAWLALPRLETTPATPIEFDLSTLTRDHPRRRHPDVAL